MWWYLMEIWRMQYVYSTTCEIPVYIQELRVLKLKTLKYVLYCSIFKLQHDVLHLIQS